MIIAKLSDVIETCDKLIKDETYCNKCKCNIKTDIMSHITNDHNISEDEKLYLEIVYNDVQTGGLNDSQMDSFNDKLFSVQVENPLIIEKFCQMHFSSCIDTDNNCYYECQINQLKNLLEECHQETNIDQLINEFDSNETILIDIPSMDKYRGTASFIPEEFVQIGGSCDNVINNPRHKIYQTKTFQWLNDNN